MNSTKKITLAAAIVSLLAISHAGALQAADNSPALTMKPFHGISFDVGAKRAVTYFLAGGETCKLVATLADVPSWDHEIPAFSAERFEASIPAGQSRRFGSSERKTLEFTCEPGAASMTVKTIEQLAVDASK